MQTLENKTLEHEIKSLIVTTMALEDVVADDIDTDAPLFNEGLGLDSIDILEISLVVARTYGTQIKAGDADNAKIFGSLRTLAQYIVDKQQNA